LRLSDMNGDQIGGPLGWWLRLYWGGIALALATMAHLLWRRGTETRLLPRLRQLPPRLKGPIGGVLVAGLLVSAVTGVWLYRQMDVLNV
ncbi:hypothetical protein, partial [Salmonella enterica]|uniref:hypothetical protein n=1 Tax=Salmonella enterica TaxID=28901 RepID=UPI003D26B9E9